MGLLGLRCRYMFDLVDFFAGDGDRVMFNSLKDSEPKRETLRILDTACYDDAPFYWQELVRHVEHAQGIITDEALQHQVDWVTRTSADSGQWQSSPSCEQGAQNRNDFEAPACDATALRAHLQHVEPVATAVAPSEVAAGKDENADDAECDEEESDDNAADGSRARVVSLHKLQANWLAQCTHNNEASQKTFGYITSLAGAAQKVLIQECAKQTIPPGIKFEFDVKDCNIVRCYWHRDVSRRRVGNKTEKNADKSDELKLSFFGDIAPSNPGGVSLTNTGCLDNLDLAVFRSELLFCLAFEIPIGTDEDATLRLVSKPIPAPISEGMPTKQTTEINVWTVVPNDKMKCMMAAGDKTIELLRPQLSSEHQTKHRKFSDFKGVLYQQADFKKPRAAKGRGKGKGRGRGKKLRMPDEDVDEVELEPFAHMMDLTLTPLV